MAILAGVVGAKARPKGEIVTKDADGKEVRKPIPGVVVEIHVQPTTGSGAYVLPVLMGRDEARALDVDDEVSITIERTGSTAPAEG